MATITGNAYAITNISDCIHDSDEISTATLTFSGSSNKLRLMWILSDVSVTRKLKMAAINRKHIGNNEYLGLYIHDSDEISTATPTFSD